MELTKDELDVLIYHHEGAGDYYLDCQKLYEGKLHDGCYSGCDVEWAKECNRRRLYHRHRTREYKKLLTTCANSYGDAEC